MIETASHFKSLVLITCLCFCQIVLSKDYVDIRSKGADVNLLDNSKAIESAIVESIKRGLPCYIPPGIWNITNPINLEECIIIPNTQNIGSLVIYGTIGLSVIKNNGTGNAISYNIKNH